MNRDILLHDLANMQHGQSLLFDATKKEIIEAAQELNLDDREFTLLTENGKIKAACHFYSGKSWGIKLVTISAVTVAVCVILLNSVLGY